MGRINMDFHCFQEKGRYRNKMLFIIKGIPQSFVSQHDANYRKTIDGIDYDKTGKIGKVAKKGKEDEQLDESGEEEECTKFAGGKVKNAQIRENNFIDQNSRFYNDARSEE